MLRFLKVLMSTSLAVEHLQSFFYTFHCSSEELLLLLHSDGFRHLQGALSPMTWSLNSSSFSIRILSFKFRLYFNSDFILMEKKLSHLCCVQELHS